MAKESTIAKAKKLKTLYERYKALGKKMPKKTRVFNVCSICGRTRGYLRKFDMCRICFRQKANLGEIPGVRKSSW